RRKIQMDFNEKNDITPTTIMKDIREVIGAVTVAEDEVVYETLEAAMEANYEETKKLMDRYENEMKQAAKDLQFERAAELRDIIYKLKKQIKNI
ncbi:MAG: UvrB/UvrC motif-containing protein, partial [Clostridiaceae bacterium]|nr:UvrB/UvrC motif-containing protein [Clostridiaceae bacterium]